MALNYNLKYQKQNFFHKVLLEKEGEIVIDRHSFRLKGKGAHDQGEAIYFADIKDLTVDGNDRLLFSTFKKEKYVLSDFSNLFESFLKDFFRVRNEFLAENLFMKVGMLYKEYDGQVEVVDRQDQVVSKGKCRIQFYEESIVVVPETGDCFAVYHNFLKSHEFDEDEYVLRLYLDNGSNVYVSKLGTSFEDAQETLESLLGKMYEKVINHLREVLPEFNATDLLKLAFLLRDNKGVQFTALKKIHEELPGKLEALAFANNPAIKEKVQNLRGLGKNDANFYLGFAFVPRPDKKELAVKAWFSYALPEKNVIALGITSNPNDATVHFFRIALNPAEIEDRLREKTGEINQSMYLLKSDLGPIFKDRREMQKSKFRTALRRLAYLRILRKSFLGKNFGPDMAQFQKDLEFVCKRAALTMHQPVPEPVAAS